MWSKYFYFEWITTFHGSVPMASPWRNRGTERAIKQRSLPWEQHGTALLANRRRSNIYYGRSPASSMSCQRTWLCWRRRRKTMPGIAAEHGDNTHTHTPQPCPRLALIAVWVGIRLCVSGNVPGFGYNWDNWEMKYLKLSHARVLLTIGILFTFSAC